MRSRRGTAPAVAVAVAVALALVVGAVQAADRGVAEPGPPLGAVLGDADRRALAAVSVRRGAATVRADPEVDLHDPGAVARAYLDAARASDPDDRGRTRLDGAGYAEPGSPPAAVGVVVLDAPPPGEVRTAAVTALDLVAADQADRRRGYRAVVRTATGPAGGASVTAASTAYLVLARQPDGRWLVAADAPDVPEVDD